MKPRNRKSLDAYNRNSETLATTYNAIKTTQAMPFLEALLPSIKGRGGKGRQALDLGCGSGRDAYWLAKKKFHVTAVDGAKGMLAQARKKHSHSNIKYIQDTLPQIAKIRKLDKTFDVVLMSAVWMHLAKDDREKIFKTVISMMNPDGFFYLTLRHGSDPKDRPMYKVSLNELKRLAKKYKMKFKNFGRNNDVRGRDHVTWDHAAVRFY